MKNELDSKRIRNIYFLLIAILCLTIISSTAILSYVFVHMNDNKNNNTTTTTEVSDYDVSKFTELNYEEFLDKFNDEEQSLIYIGRATCIHCVNFVPVLKEAQDNYNYTTYYLDLDDISTNEAENIKQLDNFLNENFGTTPMVIVIKNGTLLTTNDKEGWIGEGSLGDFEEYIEELGYEKKD